MQEINTGKMRSSPSNITIYNGSIPPGRPIFFEAIKKHLEQSSEKEGSITLVISGIDYSRSASLQQLIDYHCDTSRVRVIASKACIAHHFLRNKSRLMMQIFYICFSVSHLVSTPREELGLVLIGSNPACCYIALGLLSAMKKVSYRLLVYDLYPDIIQLRLYIPKRLITYAQGLAMLAFDRAERVVTIGQCLKSRISQTYGIHEKRVVVSSLALRAKNTEEKRGVAIERFKQRWNVLYSGNITGAHLEPLLKVVDSLNSGDNEKIRLNIVSSSKAVQSLNAGDRVSIIDNTLDRISYEKMLLSCGFSLVTLDTSYLGMMVPSKGYTSLSRGKPVIFVGPSDCQLSIDISEYKMGISIDCKHSGNNIVHLINTYIGSLSAHSYESIVRRCLDFSNQHEIDSELAACLRA